MSNFAVGEVYVCKSSNGELDVFKIIANPEPAFNTLLFYPVLVIKGDINEYPVQRGRSGFVSTSFFHKNAKYVGTNSDLIEALYVGTLWKTT